MNWLKKILCLFTKGLYYINGPDILPPPLTGEEEQRVFRLLEQKDEWAKQQLITHNLRLVVYIAKKFENTGLHIEDIISIGTIGLVKAVNTFDPQKNIKLATYASRCIENEILMVLRKAGSRRQEASIDEPLNTDSDGNELLLGDVLGTEADTVFVGLEKQDECSLLLRAVSRLPEREQLIMRLRFGLANGREYTQKEVADKIGISQSYISRLEKRIIKHLRQELERTLGV